MSLFEASGAEFSDCHQYRYRLWRIWNEEFGRACFIMLNPSTADEIANDPTVERCERRARQWGYGRLDVVNLFALRSTDPDALYARSEAAAVGPENDRHIIEAVQAAKIVVCGWGVHGALFSRGRRVLALLRAAGAEPYALALTKDGHPKHPLYIAYSARPKAIEASL